MSSRDPSPGTIFRLQVPFLRLSEGLRLVNQCPSWTLAKRSLSRSSHKKVSTRTSIACHPLIARTHMPSIQPASKWWSNLRANTSKYLRAPPWLLRKTKSVLPKRGILGPTTSQEKASRERSMWTPWCQTLATSSIKAKKSRGQAPPTTGMPVIGTRSYRVLVRHHLPFPQYKASQIKSLLAKPTKKMWAASAVMVLYPTIMIEKFMKLILDNLKLNLTRNYESFDEYQLPQHFFFFLPWIESLLPSSFGSTGFCYYYFSCKFFMIFRAMNSKASLIPVPWSALVSKKDMLLSLAISSPRSFTMTF